MVFFRPYMCAYAVICGLVAPGFLAFSDENVNNFAQSDNLTDENVELKADQFFESKLYERAIPLYQHLIDNSGFGSNDKIEKKGFYLKRIVLSQYLLGHYELAINISNQHPNNLDLSYIKALANKKLGYYNEAIIDFQGIRLQEKPSFTLNHFLN